jgi:iron only hydrogenase large subunit-like protein
MGTDDKSDIDTKIDNLCQRVDAMEVRINNIKNTVYHIAGNRGNDDRFESLTNRITMIEDIMDEKHRNK